MNGKHIVNHVGGAVRRYVSLGLATRAAKGINSLDPDGLAKQSTDVLAPDEADASFAGVVAGQPVCSNCNSPVVGDYCSLCGQRDRSIRRPLWAFLADFNDDVLALDSRLVATMVPLLFLPGALTRSFWEGRRARYVPPIRLYLLSSLFFFLVVMVADVAILKFDFTQKSVSRGSDVAEVLETQELEAGTTALPGSLELVRDRLPADVIRQIEDAENKADTNTNLTIGSAKSGGGFDMDVKMFVPLSDADESSTLGGEIFGDTIEEIRIEAEQAQLAGDEFETKALGFAESVLNGLRRAVADPGRLNGALNDALPWAMVFLLPVFAMLLRIFYWGREHRAVKQLIFSLHFHSYIFLMLTFLIIAQAVWGGVVSGWMFLAAVPLYLFLALKVASRQGWFRTFFKFLFVGFFYMIIMSLTLTTTVLVGLSEL